MKFFIFCSMVLLLVGCSTGALMDPHKPVDIGNTYKQNGVDLNLGDMHDKLAANPASKDAISTSDTLILLSYVVGLPGAFAVGWETGTALNGGNANWVIGGIGAAAWIGSIVMDLVAGAKFKKAVENYNDSLKTDQPKSTFLWRAEPFLACYPDGAAGGLRLRIP